MIYGFWKMLPTNYSFFKSYLITYEGLYVIKTNQPTINIISFQLSIIQADKEEHCRQFIG